MAIYKGAEKLCNIRVVERSEPTFQEIVFSAVGYNEINNTLTFEVVSGSATVEGAIYQLILSNVNSFEDEINRNTIFRFGDGSGDVEDIVAEDIAAYWNDDREQYEMYAVKDGKFKYNYSVKYIVEHVI